MRERSSKKKVTPGSIIAIVLVLIMAAPDLFGTILGYAIGIAIFASPFIIIYLIRKKQNPNKKSTPNRPAARQRNIPLDDCPKPFCFHRDKGEHHVRRGKEIDPWDRPDIDISKYQRKR